MAATAPRPAPEPVTEGRRAPRASRLRKRGRAAAPAGRLKESRPRSIGSDAPRDSPSPLENPLGRRSSELVPQGSERGPHPRDAGRAPPHHD